MIGKNVQVRLMRLTSKKVAASKSRAIGAQIMTDTFWCFLIVIIVLGAQNPILINKAPIFNPIISLEAPLVYPPTWSPKLKTEPRRLQQLPEPLKRKTSNVGALMVRIGFL